MKNLLGEFETTHDALLKIDELVEKAEKTKDKKEKKIILTEAQRIADEYQERCEQAGNHSKQFIRLL